MRKVSVRDLEILMESYQGLETLISEKDLCAGNAMVVTNLYFERIISDLKLESTKFQNDLSLKLNDNA